MKAAWEVWLLMMIKWETIHRRHAFRMASQRRNNFISEKPVLQCKMEHERHFRLEKIRNEKVIMDTPEIMAMSWRCLLSLDSFHGWGNILHSSKRKTKKKHPCWLMAMAELTQGYWRVPLNKQLTEREWRRPLTWLDRFRDAVLLPASWGDENIQPHVGNKYL